MYRDRLPVIDYQATGSNLRELRRKHHYSVPQLQDIFGFSNPQSIYKWERGVNLPDIENLMTLSILYRVSIESILVTDDRDASVFYS